MHNFADPITFARRLRRRQTASERRLWQQLRNRNLKGLKFRRQVPIGRYTVDFYCAALRLVIELDGEVHEYQKSYDKQRDNYLIEQGLHVMRFKNEVLYEDPELIHSMILDFALKTPSPCPSPLWGEGTRHK